MLLRWVRNRAKFSSIIVVSPLTVVVLILDELKGRARKKNIPDVLTVKMSGGRFLSGGQGVRPD
jgi:hypothetical protein